MPEISFNLAIVAAVAFGAPLLLGLVPWLRLPEVALELVAGIVIGPAVLGWVELDDAVELFALVGLAFLLLIAGLEIDFDRLRGRLLEVTGLGFLLSFGIAILIGFAFQAGGLIHAPMLVAIMLSATSLGIVIAVLKDARQGETPFGQYVIGSSSLAEVLTIVLLSLFFSSESSGTGAQILLLVSFGVLCVVVAFALLESQRSRRLSGALLRLQDTTAQIRVRGAFLLLAVFVVLADRLGLEAILGAFLAGAIVKVVDRDQMMTHPDFRRKLEAAGFGVFIPFFFVVSGIRFNLDALFSSGSTIARVPIFLAALLAVRGLPVLLYKSLTGRETVAAGFLQATSLSFFVVASEIGMNLGVISEATGATLIAAGLLAVLVFPLAGLTILRGGEQRVAERPPSYARLRLDDQGSWR